MKHWWLQQQQKLWWKEVRETWLFITLAFLFMIVHLAMSTPQRTLYNSVEFSAYIWGIGFHTSVITVLLFIAICLGVTAYAVEQEQETLTPLLAKPIPEDDIFATKLGVRLGEIFIFMIVLGVIEIWTGAWPIEWNIPAPWAFERWLGGFMIAAAGLSLGLYFGRIFGRQTQALLVTALVIVAGYVLFTISPLKLLFITDTITDTEPSRRWIADILIPLLVAVAAVVVAVPDREGESGFLVRRPVFVGGLAIFIYAVVFWTVTFIPPGVAWQQPRRYLNHLTIRLGPPEASLQVLLDRFIEARASMHEGEPAAIARQFIWRTYIRSPQSYTDDYYIRTAHTLLGKEYQPEPVTLRDRSPVDDITELEELAARHRSRNWIGRCLTVAAQPDHSDLHRLTALHLAGVANHPEHTEMIASFLESPSLTVRLMAATVLFAREDPRGTESLQNDLLTYNDVSVIYRFSSRYFRWGIDFGSEVRSLMETWLLVDPDDRTDWYRRNDGYKRNVAQIWFREHGSSADADLVRRSLWLDQSQRQRAESTPADMDILPYLKAWDAPEYPAALWRAARTELATMRQYYDQLKEIPFGARTGNRGNLSGRIREAIRIYSLAQEALGRYLTDLVQARQENAISFWTESRPFMRLEVQQRAWYHPRGETVIPLFSRLGDPGIELLAAIARDETEERTARFRAAIVLAYRGHPEYNGIVLKYFEQYQGHYYLMSSENALQAFRIMVEEGNRHFIGTLIDQAWQDFTGVVTSRDGTQRRRRYSMTMWDRRTIETLQEATGQEFGWDIKAWKRWWDRK